MSSDPARGGVLAAALLLALALPLGAADWHVATDGDDAAAGSAAAPLASLGRALERARPGDRILVAAGVYFEAGLALNQHGTEAGGIALLAKPGGRPVIDGSASPSATAPILHVTGSGYHVEGFEIRFARRTAVSIQGGSRLVLRNNWIHHSQRGAVFAFEGAHTLTLEDNRIWRNVQVNNSVGTLDGGWPSALNLSDDSDLVRGNEVFENFGEGIGAYGRGHRIEGNRLRDNFSVDLYANNLVESVVAGNFISSHDLAEFHRDGAAASGLSLANEAPASQDPNQFRDNRVVNNLVVGPRRRCLRQWNGFGGEPLRDSLIAHNSFVCAAADRAVLFDPGPHSGVVFRDNLVWQRLAERPQLVLPEAPAGIAFQRNAWFGGRSGPGAAAAVDDVTAAPQLLDPDAGEPFGYLPASGSPLRAAGDPAVADPAVDFFALPRRAPADLGAMQYRGEVLFAGGFEAIRAD